MDKKLIREVIAKRVAQELKDGDVVNLGIGLPTMVANYVSQEMDITFQSENGMLGMGSLADEETMDKNLTNAGGQHITALPGASYFDSSMSFSIIRGGHVDATVLGALQVDGKGNLANWMIPGKKVPGMGGAMDLVVGAKKVIVAMEHTAKGNHKILEECSLPLTAAGEVNLIITEKGVLEVTGEGLVLKEVSEHSSVNDIVEATGAKLIIPDHFYQI